MNAQELTLNIAVNLGRMGRCAYEGRRVRLEQFLKETEEYVNQLESISKTAGFQRTFDLFSESFNNLKNDVHLDSAWAETAYTWANILTHRAKLAC